MEERCVKPASKQGFDAQAKDYLQAASYFCLQIVFVQDPQV